LKIIGNEVRNQAGIAVVKAVSKQVNEGNKQLQTDGRN